MNRAIRLLAPGAALAAALAFLLPASGQEAAKPAKPPAGRAAPAAGEDHRMDWWRQARFGMFIHWGIYSVPAGTWKGQEYTGAAEWLMNSAKIPVEEYEPLAKQFNPVKFNAAEWVATAKEAGQKYIIITSKHHDGFCMWGTKLTKYNVVDATPYGKDVLKQLADECAKQGVKLGFYYSIMDWHHPDAKGENFPKYVEHMKGQLKELLSGEYGKIAVLWFDGEWIKEWTDEMGRDLYAYCRSLQPDIIINNRVGHSREGMSGFNKNKDAPGDFGTPEQEIPAGGLPGVDWETCMTMNGTWGFHAGDKNWKSDTVLIRDLIETSSKGGNFLLNVGPTAEGEIPPESVSRLKTMGHWLSVNGEAIYGSSASPVPSYFWGDTVAAPGRLYVCVYDWPPPKDGYVRLRGLFSKVTKATLLATGEEYEVFTHPYGTSIRVPVSGRDKAATVIRLDVDGPDDVRPRVMPQLDDNEAMILSVFDAKIEGKKARLETSQDKRCVGFWSEPTDFVSWDIDIKRPGVFELVVDGSANGKEGGGTYRIEVGDSSSEGRVPITGSWTNFVQFKPPPIVIKEAGRKILTIRPMEISHDALMNLRGVYMRRIAESGNTKSRPPGAGPGR